MLPEHIANRGGIILVFVELDIFHSDILGVVLFVKVRSLVVIRELAANDVKVLDV